MRGVFLDTSAILGLLNPADRVHETAKRIFFRLAADEVPLFTTSYVLVETFALLGRRFGLDAARSFQHKFVPLLRVVWVDETLHALAVEEWLRRSVRQLSLVDVVSFLVIQEEDLPAAFAFDRHFEEEGFTLLS
ncbi:type II toxin-antitoxin system VapC family toxin [Deferrisoma palaeochoriense]